MLGAVPTAAAERLALLTANAKVRPLKNPHYDVLFSNTRSTLSFKVPEIKHASNRLIDTATTRHIQNVRSKAQGTINFVCYSFVYYSGHGAVDPETKIVANADHDDLWINSLNLNVVIEGLRAEAPQAKHCVVFDACANELNLARKGSGRCATQKASKAPA